MHGAFSLLYSFVFFFFSLFVFFFCFYVFFFFQAEDGIRDLVRSRGLGDVYKRQIVHVPDALDPRQLIAGALKLRERNGPIHRVLGILEPLQVQLAQVLSLIHI